MSAMMSPFYGENLRLPGSKVQKQALGFQLVAVAVVVGRAELILKPPRFSGQIGERQPQPALALVGGVVHRDDQSLAGRSLPRAGDKTVVRPVSVPGGSTFPQLP